MKRYKGLLDIKERNQFYGLAEFIYITTFLFCLRYLVHSAVGASPRYTPGYTRSAPFTG